MGTFLRRRVGIFFFAPLHRSLLATYSVLTSAWEKCTSTSLYDKIPSSGTCMFRFPPRLPRHIAWSPVVCAGTEGRHDFGLLARACHAWNSSATPSLLLLLSPIPQKYQFLLLPWTLSWLAASTSQWKIAPEIRNLPMCVHCTVKLSRRGSRLQGGLI